MKKRTKQILAVLSATTMALGSGFTVMAASEKPADSTITGGGDLDYVDTSKVYEVTLPTSGALDFVIDPQGLTSLKNGESAKLEDLLNKSSIVTKDGAGAYIKNESSIGVKVTAKMSITDDNDTKVTPVATLADVTKDDNTNICLLVIPGSNKPAAIANYEASTQGIVIENMDGGATTTDFSFVLDKASYSIKKDTDGTLSYAKDAGADNFDAVSFKLGGKANGKADWSAYTGDSKKSIGVKAVFSVADATAADVVKDGYTAHGLMDLGSVKSVEVKAADVAPSISNKTVTFSKATGAEVAVDLGSGTKAATGVATVQVQKDDGSVANPWATTCYSLSNGKLTLNTTAGIAGLEVGATRKLKVTFNDTASTAVVLDVTIAE